MPGLGFWYRKAVQADSLGFNLRFQARASHSLHLPVHKHGGLRNFLRKNTMVWCIQQVGSHAFFICFDIKNMNAAPQPYAWCFKVLKISPKKNMLMNFDDSFWGFQSSKKTMCPITFPYHIYHAFIISPVFYPRVVPACQVRMLEELRKRAEERRKKMEAGQILRAPADMRKNWW